MIVHICTCLERSHVSSVTVLRTQRQSWDIRKKPHTGLVTIDQRVWFHSVRWSCVYGLRYELKWINPRRKQTFYYLSLRRQPYQRYQDNEHPISIYLDKIYAHYSWYCFKDCYFMRRKGTRVCRTDSAEREFILGRLFLSIYSMRLNSYYILAYWNWLSKMLYLACILPL